MKTLSLDKSPLSPKTMALIATGLGAAAYISGKRQDMARDGKTSLGTSAGAMLAIYALSNLKPIYGGLAAVAWLGSEVFLPGTDSIFSLDTYKRRPPVLPVAPAPVPTHAAGWPQRATWPSY
jgi:hypothetical protein